MSDAILAMGRTAIPYLIATLEERRIRHDEELLPSIERRAESLRLLGLLYVKEAVDPSLSALRDPSDKVRTEAALTLVMVEDSDRVLEAVPALVAGLTHPDFFQRDRCTEALVRIGPRCIPWIESALLQGCVSLVGETVPLTVNARTAALATRTSEGTGAMLNEAQRTCLRIAMCLIEEKMRAIESRLASPEEHGLMSDVRNDVTPEMERALREKIRSVYAVIENVRSRFALPSETKLATREIRTGLPHLWVMLQESDARSLRRYGPVDSALAPLLNPQIEMLARLMFALEDVVLGHIERAEHSVGDNEAVR